jgi:uncharacterized protein YecE (DUF72 family)
MILIGTSGYNYPEWKGSFYPADTPSAKMLPYYATRFPTVEINYTFYRMPTPKLVAGWAAQVPSTFRFTLKAPRRITHDKRLRGTADSLLAFVAAANALGPQLGALLFQLPPTFKKDLGVLNEFLAQLPGGTKAAFEFRHESWLNEQVFDALREGRAGLCIADSEARSTPVLATAGFAYFRLRDEGYTEPDLVRWAEQVRALDVQVGETFVYFKHEDAGKGAAFGQRLMELVASR